MIFIFPASSLFCQDGAQIQALKSFRITPKKKAAYMWIGAVWNPNLNLYIAMFYEFKLGIPGGPEQTLYSQLFNRKGKKAGPLNKLTTISGSDEFSFHFDMTLNEIENEIFVVWSRKSYDEILGITLSGDGRVLPGVEKKQIKKPEGPASGLFPKVVWIKSRNQYAVAWSHLTSQNPTNPDNGFYLALLKPNLKPKLKPTKVKQQSMKNYYYLVTSLLPMHDRILWGAAQDSAKKIRPVVWFTDYKGEVIKVPKAKWDGSIFPGPKAKGGAQVFVDQNPTQDQYLLMWNVGDYQDYRYRTFGNTYYRIMNSDGSFAFKKRKLPKKFRFPYDAIPVYNPQNNRFLVVYSEYKNLFVDNPLVEFQGGRLWATYIDSDGKLGLPDDPSEDAFPLTDLFTDNQTGMFLYEVIYNPFYDEYLIVFMLADYTVPYDTSSDIWGIILK
jgi:hypothetical protein